MHKMTITKFTLFLISFPKRNLLICFPLTINKLEIAFINVSIVLKVNESAKIKIPIGIIEFFFKY